MELHQRIKYRREEMGMSQEDLAKKLGYKSRSTINKIELGKNDITQSKINAFAKALGTTPEYLMGYAENAFPSPSITDDYVTFPVVGEIAAGFDHIAVESWEGEKIDIPASYLRGRKPQEFMVLAVTGDSMYPIYQDGDRVLILKQTTLDAPGDVGAVIYDDEVASLKKIEYVYGEDWMRLVPLNPIYKPELIEGERLEHCRVIGVPKLLVREIC